MRADAYSQNSAPEQIAGTLVTWDDRQRQDAEVVRPPGPCGRTMDVATQRKTAATRHSNSQASTGQIGDQGARWTQERQENTKQGDGQETALENRQAALDNDHEVR